MPLEQLQIKSAETAIELQPPTLDQFFDRHVIDPSDYNLSDKDSLTQLIQKLNESYEAIKACVDAIKHELIASANSAIAVDHQLLLIVEGDDSEKNQKYLDCVLHSFNLNLSECKYYKEHIENLVNTSSFDDKDPQSPIRMFNLHFNDIINHIAELEKEIILRFNHYFDSGKYQPYLSPDESSRVKELLTNACLGSLQKLGITSTEETQSQSQSPEKKKRETLPWSELSNKVKIDFTVTKETPIEKRKGQISLNTITSNMGSSNTTVERYVYSCLFKFREALAKELQLKNITNDDIINFLPDKDPDELKQLLSRSEKITKLAYDNYQSNDPNLRAEKVNEAINQHNQWVEDIGDWLSQLQANIPTNKYFYNRCRPRVHRAYYDAKGVTDAKVFTNNVLQNVLLSLKPFQIPELKSQSQNLETVNSDTVSEEHRNKLEELLKS